jgi:hypothetical protein
MWHFSVSILAEDISDGMMNLGFDAVSVKQMTTMIKHLLPPPKINMFWEEHIM